MQSTDHEQLLLKDLKRSALPPTAVQDYCIELLDEKQTQSLCGYPVPSAAFIYHDPDGEQRDFARVKYLRTPPENSWTQGSAPAGKYWQEAGSGNHLYFPLAAIPRRSGNWTWPQVLADPQVPLYITEGEKKALCGVQHGLPMLAVSGVNSWRSSRRFNQDVIKDFELIDFETRTVYLCFDADAITNPHVSKALSDLSVELTQRGARSIRIVEIPSNTVLGAKAGLDDYVAKFGFPAFTQVCEEAQDVKKTKALWDMNERFAFIESMAAVYDAQLRVWHRRSAFFDVTAPLTVTRLSLQGRGEEQRAVVTEEPANKVWWEWKSRRAYSAHKYGPGRPSVLGEGGTVLNTWEGWGCEPVLGNADPLLNLLSHLTQNLTPAQARWFLRWLAWPIQHPTQGKQATAVMIHSAAEGSGKSFLGEIMCDIYGANALMIGSPDQMFNAHADYLERTQFILADEVLVGTRAEVDRVKNFVTQPNLIVNPKGLPAYKAEALMNWYLTSNHSDALRLTPNDRRWFVINAPEKKLPVEMIRELREWRASGGCATAMRYLLSVPMGKYEPWQGAPDTVAKQSMVDSARSETEQWCSDLQHDPDGILCVDGVALPSDLFTENDWRERMIIPPRLKPTVVRKELTALGFERRNRIRSSHWRGAEKSLWCLRNRDYWAAQPTSAWAEHYRVYLNQRNTGVRNALNNATARRASSAKVTPLVRREK